MTRHASNLLRAAIALLAITVSIAAHAEPKRFNVLACWGDPVVTFSTHMDTVPGGIPAALGHSLDDESLWLPSEAAATVSRD